MSKLLLTLSLLILAACYPFSSVDVEARTYSYRYCTWNNPCYYHNHDMIFVNDWGWFRPREYIYYIDYPDSRARIHRHYKSVPKGKPTLVGRHKIEKRFRKT